MQQRNHIPFFPPPSHFQGYISSRSIFKSSCEPLSFIQRSEPIHETFSFKIHRNYRIHIEISFRGTRQLYSLCSCLGVLDLRNQTGFLTAHPPCHFQSSRKNDEGVLCTSSLPHTLLHQALLGLVGLRMEHDDRQKQSSAPPCSAVFYTARA